MDGETFRDGIFALRTRRFGTVAEVLVQRLYRLKKSQTLFHDLFDDTQKQRVEVKFSMVLKKHRAPITEATVLQRIAEETSSQRMIAFSAWQTSTFDSNIQQVKRPEFDILYYGLFFSDQIAIFRIASGDIGSQIGYSDKQHKGNIGEGQFHITNTNLQFHLDHHLAGQLSYDEFLEMLTE